MLHWIWTPLLATMTEFELTGALVHMVKPHDSAVMTDPIGTHAEQVRLYLGPVIRPTDMLS